MTEKAGGVLEWLARRAGTPYLSDLRPEVRTPTCTRALRRALAEVDPARFPAWDWSDAVAYLLDVTDGPDAPKAAVALLLKRL